MQEAGSSIDRTMTLDEVRERFLQDRFATANGAVIDEIGEGWAR